MKVVACTNVSTAVVDTRLRLYYPDPRQVPLWNRNIYSIIIKVPPRSTLIQSYGPWGHPLCFWPCSIRIIKSDIFYQTLFGLCLENEIYSKTVPKQIIHLGTWYLYIPTARENREWYLYRYFTGRVITTLS